MEAAEQLALIEIFRERAAAKKREAWDELVLALDDRKRQDKKEEEDRQFFDGLVATATEEQAAAFRNRLDDLDTATVHALMDNERALDDVRRHREELEASAFKLPDGRMAFKTEDGQRVFDRNGSELSRDLIDPDSIPDTKPKWEQFNGIKETEHNLLHDRDELHAFQKKIDEAHAVVNKKGVTSKELDDLGVDLQRNMPEAVRQRLPGHLPSEELAGPQAGVSETVSRVENAVGGITRRDLTL